MSDHEDLLEGQPPSIDPYEVLDLEKTASEDQIKRAYRKAALKHHPDKAPANHPKKLAAANKAFQEVAFAYAILSDPKRRKRYDETGSTSDSILDSEGFNWSDFYRNAFEDAVSADAIEKFRAEYKGSEEEKDDLLHYFELCEGDMRHVYEHVMLSDMTEDEDRFRVIIDEAIAKREVPAFGSYHKESERQRASRIKRARAAKAQEGKEAEEYAKEIGAHDKLFGKSNNKESAEDGLKALIQARQSSRAGAQDSFLDNLAEKYRGTAKKQKKGNKRAVMDEPPEEAFAATAARQTSRSSKGDPETPKKQTGKRVKR
ncbi:DnaJ domain-containing protein [Emericellopsis atlantica]|uniref:DnaJ domain-containing protein n=1 Tax=Emericellopsis atlantica TaxID=2614577 RepID=A0A9P7ZG33_9HYPO|nr:DnaJ domain-containing protein [Emericellopsis atlantica]KAG9251479.1 DnaJ domain-containing protein [Emericellopsis atlantica]